MAKPRRGLPLRAAVTVWPTLLERNEVEELKSLQIIVSAKVGGANILKVGRAISFLYRALH